MATASQRTYKPKAHLVLDCETLSTRKDAAVIEIGAVALYEVPGLDRYFNVLIKPSSYAGTESVFARDAATAAFQDKTNPGFLEECETLGRSFQEAFMLFNCWVASYADQLEVHMWSHGKDFDFPIMENLAEQCGEKPAYAYGKVHCLRDLVWLNPKQRIQRPADSVAHRALHDAIFEAKQLHAVVESNSWYQRLFS
jgi:DNA polymerase III epsilon subunit-like protein